MSSEPQGSENGGDFVRRGDAWLDLAGPQGAIVASSRVRFARNLPDVIFPPRARPEDLERAARIVEDTVRRSAMLRPYHRINLASLDDTRRKYLKESHIISNELEAGGEHRFVYLNDEGNIGMMVNEEDHLRMFCILPGLQLAEAYKRLCIVDDDFQEHSEFAYLDPFGYLSACATNTGTGMRASVMLHLPGLVMTKSLEKILIGIPEYGLTVRGYYGENSEFLGDYYQISNERTLGSGEEEILEILDKVVDLALRGETQARAFLFDERHDAIDDAIWRSFAILSSARVIDTGEAAKLLSKIRLGIDRGYFRSLSHERLNKLVVEIQPGHLMLDLGPSASEPDKRDIARARLLRDRMADIARRN